MLGLRHQVRVISFCLAQTFSPGLFWPCCLQISLETQSCKRLYVRNVTQYYQDLKDLPDSECWRPPMHTLLALLSSPWFSSKQWKNNTSVKLSWRTGNSLSWKRLSPSSLSSFLQPAVPWDTNEGGNTQKCVVSALWKQDLPDSHQSVLDLTGVARQLPVLQRWRYVRWLWFTICGNGYI